MEYTGAASFSVWRRLGIGENETEYQLLSLVLRLKMICGIIYTRTVGDAGPYDLTMPSTQDDMGVVRRERVGFHEASEAELWGFRACPRPTKISGGILYAGDS